MTPRSRDLERLPRLSRRALILGAAGVLAGAAVMATLGFTAGRPAEAVPRAAIASPSASAATAGQLKTLSLTEVRGHKPMEASSGSQESPLP